MEPILRILRKTKSQYQTELSNLGSGVSLKGEYLGSAKKTLHTCRCGIEWSASPNCILRGVLCRECGAAKSASKQRKTSAAYCKELFAVNPAVVLLSIYKGHDTPVEHLCACGKTWVVRPADALRGKSCRACGLKRSSDHFRKSETAYIKELTDLRPSITLFGKFVGSKIPVNHKCSCGNIWKVRPNDVLRGVSCRNCGNEKISYSKGKTEEQYIADLRSANPGVTLSGNYAGSANPVYHLCVCGNKWRTRPDDALAGKRCLSCANKSFPVSFSGGHVKLLRSKPEEMAARRILREYSLKPLHLKSDLEGEVPIIPYFLNGKKHKFKPDFIAPSINTIFEVKDLNSFGLGRTFFSSTPAQMFERSKAKALATIKAGFACEFLIITKSGHRINLPDGWWRFTRGKLLGDLNL